MSTRATLKFDDDEPIAAPPSVSPEAIRAATRSAGFHETPRPAGAVADAPPARRARRKTGRVHPFATRIREDTLAEIHAYADQHEISLAEVIERAMAALAKS